ncbi:MAG TPA: hypothetical protein PKU78_04645, partial [Candidatus Dojkabacteria bacterium]|nr:hypothetical protein [Candidatus Dojkabacteria bacterium]
MKAVKSKHSSHNKGGSVLEGLGSHMEKSDLIKALNEKHNQIKFMQKKIDTLQKENRSLTRVIQSNTPSTITILINKILPYEKTKSKVISLLRIYKYAGLAVFINHIASKIVGKQYIGLEEIEYLRWQKKFEINVFKDLTNRIDS